MTLVYTAASQSLAILEAGWIVDPNRLTISSWKPAVVTWTAGRAPVSCPVTHIDDSDSLQVFDLGLRNRGTLGNGVAGVS